MTKKIVFLIYGEGHNDRQSISNLVLAVAGVGKVVRVRLIADPIILSRNAERSGKRGKVFDAISSTYRLIKGRGDRAVVVLHRDCDAVEPAHVAEIEDALGAMKARGVEDVVVAAPAWEIETWWMLFPDQVAMVRRCWDKIDYSSQNVGMIQNSKERLRADLKPKDRERARRCPDFEERDGVAVTEKIRESPESINHAIGKCESFRQFVGAVRCAVEDSGNKNVARNRGVLPSGKSVTVY
jgi:hypothetical protein